MFHDVETCSSLAGPSVKITSVHGVNLLDKRREEALLRAMLDIHLLFMLLLWPSAGYFKCDFGRSTTFCSSKVGVPSLHQKIYKHVALFLYSDKRTAAFCDEYFGA